MKICADYLYTKNDEWVKIDGNTATIGITDYAQDALSDIVFVEITVVVDDELEAEDNIATVESIKAASDVYAPVAGKVVATNEDLTDAPEKMNTDPFGEAWLVKIESDNFDVSGLMDAASYEAYCAERD